MRSIVAVVALACACSSEDPTPAGPRLPNSSIKPAGSGWACFRERVENVSVCVRPENCDAARLSARDELERTGAAYDLTTCAARSGVSCMTMRPTTGTKTIWLCAESASDCLKLADYYRTHPVDYADVSTCAAW